MLNIIITYDLATIQDKVYRYINNNYGSVPKAQKRLGINSVSMLRAYIAQNFLKEQKVATDRYVKSQIGIAKVKANESDRNLQGINDYVPPSNVDVRSANNIEVVKIGSTRPTTLGNDNNTLVSYTTAANDMAARYPNYGLPQNSPYVTVNTNIPNESADNSVFSQYVDQRYGGGMSVVRDRADYGNISNSIPNISGIISDSKKNVYTGSQETVSNIRDVRSDPVLFDMAKKNKTNDLVRTPSVSNSQGFSKTAKELEYQSYKAYNKRDTNVGNLGNSIGYGVGAFTLGFTQRFVKLGTDPIGYGKEVGHGVVSLVSDPIGTGKSLVSEFRTNPYGTTGSFAGDAVILDFAGKAVKKVPSTVQKYNPNSAYYVKSLPDGFEPHKGSFSQELLVYKGEPVVRNGKAYGIRRSTSFDIKQPNTYYDALMRTVTNNPKYKPGRIKNFDPFGENILLKNAPSEYANPIIERGLVSNSQFITSAKPDIGYVSDSLSTKTPIRVMPGGGGMVDTISGRMGTGGIELGEFFAPRTVKTLTYGDTIIPKGTPQVYTYYTGIGASYSDVLSGRAKFSLFPKEKGFIVGQEKVSGRGAVSNKAYVGLSQELVNPGSVQLSSSTLRGIRSESEVIKSPGGLVNVNRRFQNVYYPSGEKLSVYSTRDVKLTNPQKIGAYSYLIDYTINERIPGVKSFVEANPSQRLKGEKIISTERANIDRYNREIVKLGGEPVKVDIIKSEGVSVGSKGVVGERVRTSSASRGFYTPNYGKLMSTLSGGLSSFTSKVKSGFTPVSSTKTISGGISVSTPSYSSPTSSFNSLSNNSYSTPTFSSTLSSSSSNKSISSSVGTPSYSSPTSSFNSLSNNSYSTPTFSSTLSSSSSNKSISSLSSTGSYYSSSSFSKLSSSSSPSSSTGYKRYVPSVDEVLKKKKRGKNNNYFGYAVRKAGKFTIVQKGLTYKDAFKGLENNLYTTPRASGMIIDTRTNKSVKLKSISAGYTTGKKNKNLLVEKNTNRINTPGELKGITYKGISTKRMY